MLGSRYQLPIGRRRAPRAALRCVFVTQWYLPEPSRVPVEIVRALSEDFEMSVLTGVPHYPTGRAQPGYRATSARTDEFDGITVHRTPEYPSHSSSGAGRILSYVSWAVSAATLGLKHLRRADVTLVYSSPATAALPAIAARLLCRTPYVLMVQDLWPDSVYAAGFASRPLRALRPMLEMACRAAYRLAEHICVISPGMVDVLASRGVPREKISLVYNWVSTSPPSTPPPARFAGGPPRVLYAGNHGLAQNLGPVIAAFARRPDVHLSLVGDGVEKPVLVETVRRLGAENIEFHDPEPTAVLADRVAAADIQLVALARDPLFEVTMPSKVQAILAAGKPILAVASGDVASVVHEAQCGWAVDPGDDAGLDRALSEIASTSPAQISALGANSSMYYSMTMSRERGQATLRQVLQEAAEWRTRKGERR